MFETTANLERFDNDREWGQFELMPIGATADGEFHKTLNGFKALNVEGYGEYELGAEEVAEMRNETTKPNPFAATIYTTQEITARTAGELAFKVLVGRLEDQYAGKAAAIGVELFIDLPLASPACELSALEKVLGYLIEQTIKLEPASIIVNGEIGKGELAISINAFAAKGEAFKCSSRSVSGNLQQQAASRGLNIKNSQTSSQRVSYTMTTAIQA